MPIREFVIKFASRCNLACDYCYVYRGEDQNWRTQPPVMSQEVVAAAARRIAEHARRHKLRSVHVVFHGGEPLLAGTAALESAMNSMQAVMPSDTDLRLGIQTNGVLLDDQLLDLFVRYQVQVGISIDGGRAAHDRHRLHANGRGSYANVARAITALQNISQPKLLTRLLCVIDLGNDPISTYEELAEFSPPEIDFLLPLGNWSRQPPGLQRSCHPSKLSSMKRSDYTPYADWLIAMFDHWYPLSEAPSIRFFNEIINLLLGGYPGNEILGGGVPKYVIVQTDGTIEGSDSAKSMSGKGGTEISVLSHSFDDALGHPALLAERRGSGGLADACRPCPVLSVCGGGQYAHRYQVGSGFQHPSVYCPDLSHIINHVGSCVLADLKAIRYDS